MVNGMIFTHAGKVLAKESIVGLSSMKITAALMPTSLEACIKGKLILEGPEVMKIKHSRLNQAFTTKMLSLKFNYTQGCGFALDQWEM